MPRGGPRGSFELDQDKALNYDALRPEDILMVIIPSPNVEQESTRRFKGIHSRGHLEIVEGSRSQQSYAGLRFSIIELDMLETAAAALGVRRHHFIRQAALSMAEAVLHGSRSEDHPYTRVSSDGYQRRRATNFSES
jgi:hypothetical protein